MTSHPTAATNGSESLFVSPSFRGEVLQPGDADFAKQSALWNAYFQHKPSVILRPRNARDVQAALLWAQENNTRLTVKCGGHSLKGVSVQDGLPLLDLSLMRSVRVNPKKQWAWVGGGCLLGDVDAETAVHDLGTPLGQIPHTGVGGLISGGGYGFLTRQYGMAIDNMLAAEVVTADGSILRVSEREDEHPDLFWALRGGGGNYGIITGFKLRLHKLQRAPDGTHGLGGHIFYDFSNAKRLAELLNEVMKEAPKNLCTHYAVVNPPPLDFKPAVALIFVWIGDQVEGNKYLQRFLDEKPLINTVKPLSYDDIQKINEPLAPPGLEYYISFRYLKSEAMADGTFVDLIHKVAATKPPPCVIQLENFGGAEDNTTTAFVNRNHEWILGFAGIVRPGAPWDFEAIKAWVKDSILASSDITEVAGYGNLAGSDAATALDTETAFGQSYEKLKQIKHKYDPNDFFIYVTNHIF